MKSLISLIFIGALIGLGAMVNRGLPTPTATQSPATDQPSVSVTSPATVTQDWAPGGQLFFLTENGSALEIHSLDVTNGKERMIFSDKGKTNGIKLVSRVARSGDSIIAVIGPGSDNRGHLVAIKTDGSGKLTTLVDDFDVTAAPAISPDQTKLAFSRFINTDSVFGFTLNIAGVDGKDEQTLVTNPDGVSSPSFSPDGKQLGFIRGASTKGTELATYDIASKTNGTLYKKDQTIIQDLDWGSVGLVAFTAAPLKRATVGEFDPYLLDPKTNELIKLVDTKLVERSVTVAPDASAVAFLQVPSEKYTPNEPGTIVVSSIDGKQQTQFKQAIELLGWVK